MVKVTIVDNGRLEFYVDSQKMFDIMMSNLWALMSPKRVTLIANGIEITSFEDPEINEIYDLGKHVSWDTSDLLDQLAEAGEDTGLRWVCRESTSGRGLRLHQTTAEDFHPLAGTPTYPTPKAALEAFLENRSGLPPLKEVPSRGVI